MRVVSSIPGRLRLRIQPRRQAELQRFSEALQALPGIELVRYNGDSGGLLIRYDQRQIAFDDIQALLVRLGAVFDEPPPEERQAALALSSAVGKLNQRVDRATGGSVDLRFVVPATLAALALRQLSTQGAQLNQVPWYVLAWYAFDSYLKFNRPQER